MRKQCIIDMTSPYPFASWKDSIPQSTVLLVRKTITYQYPYEYQNFKKEIQALRSLRHEYLVNLDHCLEDASSMQLYFQYVPLKLQRWLALINQEIVQNLQAQMLMLVDYLNQSGVKFEFDPNCIGMTDKLNLKYFLNDFTVDHQNKQENCTQVTHQVKQYFQKFLGGGNMQQMQLEKDARFQSISTIESMIIHQSIDPTEEEQESRKLDELRKLYKRGICQKNASQRSAIEEKVESSKKKSIEVLLRFRNMKQRKC